MPGKVVLSHYTIRRSANPAQELARDILKLRLLSRINIMKWRYQNEEEKEEESQQVVTINAGPPAGGAVTKIVENNLYFYGDITESNALELNAALYEMDKKLSVTNLVFGC